MYIYAHIHVGEIFTHVYIRSSYAFIEYAYIYMYIYMYMYIYIYISRSSPNPKTMLGMTGLPDELLYT